MDAKYGSFGGVDIVSKEGGDEDGQFTGGGEKLNSTMNILSVLVLICIVLIWFFVFTIASDDKKLKAIGQSLSSATAMI